MPAITRQQVLTIGRGTVLFGANKGQWPGINPVTLFTPSLNLNNSAAGTPVSPYLPGSGDPAAQTFTIIADPSTTIVDSVTSNNVSISRNGGNFQTANATLQQYERDYHNSGVILQKKLK